MTPKKKPSAKPDGIIRAASSAIKDAGDWKASVDLTLARHGKEINELTKSTLKGLEETFESLRSHSGHIREIRESIDHQRVVQNIVLASIFVLIVAVSYLLTR
ncbi:MAG: hypothetical protein WAN16_03620 [Chthoniobacterales bacterium]